MTINVLKTMIANLPLIFAKGSPTSLTKITAEELEKFITFMVTCSWGHDTVKDIRKPPWWPRNVAFTHPFVRHAEVPKDWAARLKNLVRKCYEYHKSTFLLVFSAQLARYPRNRLRYVDNHDHTTSLYYKPSSRLLVTFRNENLYYDNDSLDLDVDSVDLDAVICVEPPKPADIYLCDNCDSHFDNFDVLTAHERLCNNENLPSSTCSGSLNEFLSALKLQPLGSNAEVTSTGKIEADNKPRNSRSVTNIDRGPPYPFSSLAYMKNAKCNIQRDTSYSRERIERYCCQTVLPGKPHSNKTRTPQFPVRYRRPIDYWHRKHTFPDQRNKKILDLNGQLLLLKCRPITVDVQQMSERSMQDYIDKLRKEAAERAEKDIIYVDSVECEPAAPGESHDPLRRADVDCDVTDAQCDPMKAECEVIDLCSDDEGGSVNENCDPRAGVACVMKGGAVLRRAPPATPRVLPAEPSGARHRPLPHDQRAPTPPAHSLRTTDQCARRTLPAVLQPHPVILIAHTNHLQTISLE